MTAFRLPPNPRRNALELGIVALIVASIIFAVRAPDVEAFVAARRGAVDLPCSSGKTPEDTRRQLGAWLFEKAIEGPSTKPCSIRVASPDELGPAQTLFASLAIVLLCSGVVVLVGPRLRFWPRGALLGSKPFVACVTFGAGLAALAAGLRYRLHHTHDSVAEQFRAYTDACTALRGHVANDLTPLASARDAYCASHKGNAVCEAGGDAKKLDAACQTLCASGEGRKTSVCDVYRLHLSNRDKLVSSLSFETCHDAAEKQPLATLAVYAKKVGFGNATPGEGSKADAAAAQPEADTSGGPDAGTDAKTGSGAGGGGGGGARSKPSPDAGPGKEEDGGGATRTTTIEEIEADLRQKYPWLKAQQAAAIAALIMMGIPIHVALPLGLMGGKGEDVEVTRQKIIREVETQRAKGVEPSITPASADELAEKAKRDPSLRPALAHLPNTPGVERVRGTLECAKTTTSTKEICSAKNGQEVVGQIGKQSCASASVDRNGLAALVCCQCSPPGAGCADFVKNRSYVCEGKP